MSNHYLYCVINACEPIKFESKGIELGEIQCFYNKDICILYSIVKRYSIEQSLENLKIHNQIVMDAMKIGETLPFQFGTVIKGEEEIIKIIEELHSQFKENFLKLSGKIEMGIKVFGEIGDEIDYNTNSPAMERLMTIKEKTDSVDFLLNKLKLIQMEKARKEYIQGLSDEMFNPFISLADESKIIIEQNRKQLLNGVFLIKSENSEIFKEMIEKIKTMYPQYSFIYSGPWPPYNFVNVVRKGDQNG